MEKQVVEKKDTIGGLKAKLLSLQNRLDKPSEETKSQRKTTLVNVRWSDGYLEVFDCTQVRQGGEIVWLRLTNGQNRTIPLSRVRWFSTDPESHASKEAM